MNRDVQRGLNDRFYEKRKAAALELEKCIRQCVEEKDYAKIRSIVDQLCHEFAYAVHQPNARNGGLIGLAASAIALGPNVAEYLEDIIPPVLACFGDQDARVRYYACESMYNIAKVAKGEILLYFNEIFDALCRLAADSELTVKNGADLLDRLIKDIVAEKAATYVSVIHTTPEPIPPDPAASETDPSKPVLAHEPVQDPSNDQAFSLARFIPLLTDRIYVINPFTRMFLVSWITLLDSIPDLELVSYLPEIIGGLLNFLSDTNEDVRIATEGALDGFLAEITRISELKRSVNEIRAERAFQQRELEAQLVPVIEAASSANGADVTKQDTKLTDPVADKPKPDADAASPNSELVVATADSVQDDAPTDEGTESVDAGPAIDEEEQNNMENTIMEGVYLPGQDVKVDFAKVIDILLSHLDSTEQEIQLTVLKWIEAFFDISPDDLLPFVPRFLSLLLPTMAHDNEQLRKAAARVNTELMQLIMSLPDSTSKAMSRSQIQDGEENENYSSTPATPLWSGTGHRSLSPRPNRSLSPPAAFGRRSISTERRGREEESLMTKLASTNLANPAPRYAPYAAPSAPVDESQAITSTTSGRFISAQQIELLLDYPATVNALTLHFLNEREETRVAALDWLIMLHRKASRKILAINDGTFPALLKTLSDSSDLVVTKDLQLLAQISYNSEDEYFASFMLNLLSLFSTDRKLLETRGNLIIRQLCVSLNSERIYRTLAEILERDDDVEFASIMIQNLNNNLITAPELQGLRRRLRNLDTKDGTNFFVTLFRSWCHNAVATFSLCLLAQAYEQAFHLLQIFADLEITVSLLIQVDKLIQLLESPVFTYLRLQLLEPEKYPFLYRCLYGLLMLLPQSSAFATLRNRLNSVSAIGYLHIVPQPAMISSSSNVANPATTGKQAVFNRFKGRIDESRWNDLLDKFRTVQMKHERQRRHAQSRAGLSALDIPNSTSHRATTSSTPQPQPPQQVQAQMSTHHHRSGLSFMSGGKPFSATAFGNNAVFGGVSSSSVRDQPRLAKSGKK
ncbi:vacuolar protein 14 C-terminal Fig4p binding-domain-containing protein [Limtongia smithiae]|uniref:vacuolar protein 14 C-terminal Fig4p binding-domain-containing protein n=1 Tax=Limtongia smithiae TaxID=1125753 RepID=UPI0034CDA9A5